MNTYRYTLEKYRGLSTRYTCPQCGRKHTFTRYIDTDNTIAYPKGTLFNAKYRSPKDLEPDAIKELYQPGNYEFKLRRGSRNTMYPASFYGNPTIYFRNKRDEKEYNHIFDEIIETQK